MTDEQFKKLAAELNSEPYDDVAYREKLIDHQRIYGTDPDVVEALKTEFQRRYGRPAAWTDIGFGWLRHRDEKRPLGKCYGETPDPPLVQPVQLDGQAFRVRGNGPWEPSLFASPRRRRMTAEQLVDSLFAAAGKRFGAEQLSMDPEGRRPADKFLNLGAPERAWQLTSLSNERDRPALSMPVAQSIVDLLDAYGWRQSRQDPITVRDETPTALQPLTLANGLIGRRIVTLSDDGALVDICLDDLTLSQMIDAVSLQLLSRPATSKERAQLAELLSAGFETRIVAGAKPAGFTRNWQRHAVSWSNHLHPRATEVMMQLEHDAQRGDPPTKRLQVDWRERMEDVVWALVNSPEFVFVP